MLIIGVDYHPSFQQIAYVDNETGECGEQRLMHSEGEAERFYRELRQRGVVVRVGMEATGHARWFERLLAELDFELWIGDPAQIRAKRVRKQKTDREDARLLLTLLIENRFPRIWVADVKNRDLRQLLWHRHRLVQIRTRIMNQLQAVAMNEGLRRQQRLWSQAGRAQLESLTSPHPISQEELREAFNASDGMECRHHRTGPHSDELPRRCTGWFATINPDNLSQCAAPSVDPSKRLDVPGEYWRPRRKPRGQELKTRTHPDPNRVSRIAAQP